MNGHIEGPVEDAVDQSQGFARYVPSGEYAKNKVSSGHRFVYTAHWITNQSNESLKQNLRKLKHELYFPFSIDLEVQIFPSWRIKKTGIYHVFNDVFSLAAHSDTKLIAGRHLKISLSTSCEACAEHALQEYGRRLAASIQFTLGVSAALSLSLESVTDLVKGQTTETTLGVTVYPEVIGDGQSEAVPPLQNFPKRHPRWTNEARALFVTAIDSNESWKRFLFLWLALEAQIGAKGKKREKFCKEALNSEEINAEMNRLRNIRVEIAHYGSQTVNVNDCTSLLFLFRICCMPQGEDRNSACDSYVKWLTTKAAKDGD